MFLPLSMMTMGPVDGDGERRFGFFFMRNVAYLDTLELASSTVYSNASCRRCRACACPKLSQQQVAFFPYVSAARMRFMVKTNTG